MTDIQDAPRVHRCEGVLLLDGMGEQEPFVATVIISPDGTIASIEEASGARADLSVGVICES